MRTFQARGNSILSVLFVSLLLSALLLEVSRDVISLYKLFQITTTSEELNNQLLSELIEIPLDDKEYSELNLKKGKIHLTKKLNYQLSNNNRRLYQFTDGAAIEHKCSPEYLHHLLKIHPKVLIPGETAIAIKTCKKRQMNATESINHYNYNIEAKSLASKESTNTLFINGYLYVEKLQLNHDLSIIAAGSIVIEEITAKNTDYLTLISLTGDIRILSSQEINNIYIDAYRESELPENIRKNRVETSPFIRTTPGWIRNYVPSELTDS